MRAVVQRVSEAAVSVEGARCAEIQRGMLVLVGIEQQDSKPVMDAFAQKLLSFRIFSDQQGKMNLNVSQAGGALLLVSQFTLAADTRRGNRPGFSCAAAPDTARSLYEYLITVLRERNQVPVHSGIFAADMQVSLVNDGPVTFTFAL